MNQNTPSQMKSQQKMTAILGIALIIALIGWISAATRTVDSANLAERLESCDGLAVASENEDCVKAMNELRDLLTTYQSALSDIDAPALEDEPAQTSTSTGTTTR